MMLAATSREEVIAWSAAMILLLIGGMAFAFWLKRRMKREDDAPAPAAGFTLSDLRQLHRDGQLSDEEFAKAKEKIVVAAQKAAERIKPQGDPSRDSTDAIRARRAARETQEPRDPDQEGPNLI